MLKKLSDKRLTLIKAIVGYDAVYNFKNVFCNVDQKVSNFSELL